jgi:hypothetical protein
MDSTRKTALIVGVLFIVTFITSIPGLLLYQPALKHHDWIISAEPEARIAIGAFLEIILAVANIGTAVILFPILKRQSERVALGYVAARIVESTVIVVGIVSVLALLTLRQNIGGVGASDPAMLKTVGRSLVAIHDRTFLLGPGYCAGLGNGVLLGYLLFKSGLVPRRMTLLGLVGGPLVVFGSTLVLFDAFSQTSTASGIFTLPEFLWELSLGIYLIVKGFKPSPILGTGGVSESGPNIGLAAT